MKHLFRFFLIVFLIAVTLFVTLFFDVSFGETPAVTVGFCQTHGFLQIKAVLPLSLAKMSDAFFRLTDPLPKALTEPPLALLRVTLALLSDIRAIYLAETAGCTALS